MGDKFVFIGPTGWQVVGLVAIIAVLAYWLARKPGAPPPTIVLFFRALTWTLLPALRSWSERSRARAVNNYAYDMSNGDEWEEEEEDDIDVAATTATTQQQSIAIQQNERNALLFQQQARDAAKLVRSGICGETKALQIIFEVRPSSTNPRYIAARAALKAELENATPIAGRTTAAKFAPR